MRSISYQSFTQETESAMRRYKEQYARAVHPEDDQLERGLCIGQSVATYFIWLKLTSDEQNAGDVARLRALLVPQSREHTRALCEYTRTSTASPAKARGLL